MRRTILLACLIMIAPYSYAEQSWFDSALEFLGMGSDETEAGELKQPAKVESAVAADAMSAAAATAGKLAAGSSLASMITSQLGVTDTQAEGGLGTIFGLAKSTLGATDFGQLSSMVPEMDILLAAAPALSENAKGLSSLMGSAGKYGTALQGATQAYSQFKTLGIGVDQIPQYISVTNEFLESKGGDDTVALFKKGVSSLLAADG
ncbi:MAG: hypothetical protein ACJAYW_000877 [Candidatus Azotimanducaceae bacterium]|jgi:hypothetical protein